ncbi:hypothetical protein U9M48_004263, partial [Paspalum notatum var. saurae]
MRRLLLSGFLVMAWPDLATGAPIKGKREGNFFLASWPCSSAPCRCSFSSTGNARLGGALEEADGVKPLLPALQDFGWRWKLTLETNFETYQLWNDRGVGLSKEQLAMWPRDNGQYDQ